MSIRLTALNSFQFIPQAGNPTYLNRGLQGDDIAYDPLTKTVFVAYTDDPDGATGTTFLPKRALLQFGSNNPSSPQAFGTYISGFDVSPGLLANAVGVTPITSGLGSGNFLVASATTDATNTTEIVEYKPDGTIATDGLLGTTGKLTLPPQYYTNTGVLASNGQPGAGRPVALALTGLGTLLVAMSQSQDLVEFSLTEKNADGTAKVLSTFDLTPFGLTRLAGLAIDPISGNFIVTDDFGGGTGLIYEFTPHRKELLTATITATVAGTPTSFPYPQEVNFPRLGNLVTIINPKQEFNLQDPEGVSFDSQNRQLYVVFDGDDFTDSTNNKVSVFSVATLDPNPPNPTDLNATPVPVLTDFSKFGQENGTIAFASTDFTSRFTNSKTAPLTLQAIDIVTLPKHGSLKLAGVNVTRGQVIAASQLSNLVYTPNPAYSGTDTFLVQAAETLDAAGKPAITAPAITNVDLFVSDTTAIQVSSATNSYRFLSADDIVFNPTTGTIFAAESYRFNNTTAQSTVWVLKEINATTGAEIRAILQSPATSILNTAGASYTALPNVPIVDLLPGDLREGIQGIGVVAGTGTARDGNILLLSTRGRRIVEIDPDAPVDANGALQVPTGGIDFIVTDFFNPNNPGIVNDGLHLPGGAFTVSPGALGSAVGVFHAVVGGQEFLYVADYSTRELVQYSKTGAKTGVVVDLQQITNGRLQGVTQDPVTGNFLLVDEETIAIYEVTPTGQLVGITDILSKATGDAAQQNKFRDVEGATIDPVTRTLYLGFDDDQPGPAGAFGDDTIGNLIAAFDLSGGIPDPTNPDVIRGTNLRDQIIAANTGTTTEVTINLTAGSYVLSGVGNDDTAVLGDLDIAAGKTIKIIGAGEDQTIIDGTALGDRIFQVFGRLELSGVTLKNGGYQNTDINTIFSNPFNGGAILVAGQDASLSVTDSTITDNIADNGAGIFIFGGEATVTGSTISDNESSFDAGGISALFGGRLTLTDSIVSDNTAARDAGGIGIAFGGSAIITGGRIIGNDAVGTFTASGPGTYGIGGGVHHNDGTTTITGTIIAGNTASEFGGGVAAYTASTFNPIFNANVTPGTLTIRDARISGNTADSNADGVGDGGGLYRLDTVAGGLTPVTVTIGNTALRAGSVVGNFDTPNGAGPGNIFDSIAGTIVSSGFNIVTNPAGSTGLRGLDQFPFDVSGFGNGINLSPISSFTFDGGDGVDFHNGQIYALQTNITNPNPFTFNSDVVTLNLDGTEVSRFNLSNTIDASGIDVRRDNGNLLIVSGLGGWVREYTPDGVQVTSEDAIDFDLPKLADGSLIVGLEFNPVTQTVYVADVGSQFDKAIIRQYDRLGNALSTLDLKVIEGIPDTIVPQGLTIDFNRGNFLVADEVNDSIYEITRFGSLLNTFNLVTLGGGDAKFGDPEGLAVDEATDTLYVIFDNDNPDQVGNLVASYQIDPTTPSTTGRLLLGDSFAFSDEAGVSTSVTPERGLQGDGITYNATTGTLFVARTDDPDGPSGPEPRVQSVLEFNTDGTYVGEFVFDAAQVPAGITTLPNGNLLIASPNPVADGAFDGKIIEVTVTGEVVSGGINFDLPDAFNSRDQRGLVVGVAYSPAYPTNSRLRSKEDTILVITSRSQEIVEFDLQGNIVSSVDLSQYGVTAPQGLAIDPATGNIFVADEATTSGGTNKIYEISPLRDELAVVPSNTRIPRFGSLVSVIDTAAAFGLSDPEGLSFGSDGTLYAVFDGDDAAGSNQIAAFSVQVPTGLPSLRTLDKFAVAGVASSFALTEFTTQAAQDFAPTVPVFSSTAGSLASITLMSLPQFGSLTLNGAAVTLGQTIAAAEIGNLSYLANSTFSGVDTFQVTAFDGTASSSPAHVDLFVSAPTARKLTATDTFNIDLGNLANDDRFDNSADGLVFNPINGKVYTASSFRINPIDASTIGWRLIESNPDGSEPTVILQSEVGALAVDGQTPFTPLAGVPVLDLVPNDTTDGVQDLGVVLGTGTARDGNILVLSTRGASIFEVTPDGAPVAGGINISAPGLFEAGGALSRSAVGLLHTVENGQEYIYVTDFGERLIRKVPARTGTIASPAILTTADVISEIKLQTALPEARLQGITIDPLTGNFFVADDASGNAAIYEIKPDGTIVGSTDMLALGRELGLSQGLSGAELTAFTNKFADLEGITIDPTTRTLYAGIDDDGVGQFGLAAIGRQVVTIALDQPPAFAEDLSTGTPSGDTAIANDPTSTVDIDGINDLIFTGAGADEVDTAFAVDSPFAGNNRIFTGSGADLTTVADNDRAFGGSGDDVFEATDAEGYRLSGGAGADQFFLGVGGRALGGDGDDTFFVGEGGDNLLSGGAGADAFWILTDDPALLENKPNRIVDYRIGTDVIGIANQFADSVDDLTLSGGNISLGGVLIAILNGVNAVDATFVFGNPFSG